MIEDVAKRMKENEVEISVTEAAKDWLAGEGFDEAYGARPLRRAIQRQVEDSLSEELLRGTFSRGDKVVIDIKDGRVVVLPLRS